MDLQTMARDIRRLPAFGGAGTLSEDGDGSSAFSTALSVFPGALPAFPSRRADCAQMLGGAAMRPARRSPGHALLKIPAGSPMRPPKRLARDGDPGRTDRSHTRP